jgi:hypothetical protein
MMSEFDQEPLLYHNSDEEVDLLFAQPKKDDSHRLSSEPSQQVSGNYEAESSPPGYSVSQQLPSVEIQGNDQSWRPVKVTSLADDVEQQQAEYVARESFTGQIVAAYFTTWLCCWICGLVAFVLALGASNHSNTGSALKARKLGRLSYGFSIAGIAAGVILTIVIIVVYVVVMKPVITQWAQYETTNFDQQYRG